MNKNKAPNDKTDLSFVLATAITPSVASSFNCVADAEFTSATSSCVNKGPLEFDVELTEVLVLAPSSGCFCGSACSTAGETWASLQIIFKIKI